MGGQRRPSRLCETEAQDKPLVACSIQWPPQKMAYTWGKKRQYLRRRPGQDLAENGLRIGQKTTYQQSPIGHQRELPAACAPIPTVTAAASESPEYLTTHSRYKSARSRKWKLRVQSTRRTSQAALRCAPGQPKRPARASTLSAVEPSKARRNEP
jgi:hypothetical protein